MSYTREKLVFRLSDLKKEPMDGSGPTESLPAS